MWQLIKTELWYNRLFVALIVLLPPSIYLLYSIGERILIGPGIDEGPSLGIIRLIGILLVVNFLMKPHHKNNRDHMHILLPISAKESGAVRIITTLTYLCILGIVLFLMWWLLPHSLPIPFKYTLIAMSAFLTLYSCIYIFNDIFCTRRQQMTAAVIGVIVGLNLLGFLVFRMANRGETPEWLTRAFQIIEGSIRFVNTTEGTWMFLAFSLGVASLSVFTYMQRRTYLE